jgi:FKBP-type peptidyl-prolyl cis-trans isomerase 2
LEIDGDVVVIDANHPLAGKKLIFDLDLVDITSEG